MAARAFAWQQAVGGKDLIQDATERSGSGVETVRAALLTNFIAPYRVPLLECLQRRVGELRVFLSTRMEPDRPWRPEWGDLKVVVQRTITLTRHLRRPGGIRQQLYIHLPYDTLPQLLRYCPEIVISGEMGARSFQAALYRLFRPRSRLLLWATLSEHTERNWGAGRRILRRFILRQADGVLVNGHSGARYVTGLVAGSRAFIINQPVDTALYADTPLARSPAEAWRLIYSGRLIAQKGVLELQRALATWAERHPQRSVEIVWAGNGAAAAELAAAALPDNLRQSFTGHVDYAELARLYATCGALILPTHFDEWGLVVNEAMASGLPVLGSIYSQAVEEMVEEGRTGWLFDPLRPESLAAALTHFLDAPAEQLAAMRAQARARGLAITPESVADRITTAMKAVLPAGRNAASATTRVDG